MKPDENEFGKDIIPSVDDIAEYYRNLEKEQSANDTPQKNDSPLPENTSESSPEVNEESIYETDRKKKNNIIFFSVSSAISLIILICFFFAGNSVKKAEEDINFELAHIKDNSTEYSDAEKSISDTEEAINSLSSEIEEKQAELNTITEYESNTGELKSRLRVLNDEMNGLNNDINSREKTVSELDSSISTKSLISCTLTPGIYVAGQNINSGQYNATGNGILTIADEKGNLRINTILNSEPFTCQLKDGDMIKIETSAVFIPVQ